MIENELQHFIFYIKHCLNHQAYSPTFFFYNAVIQDH